MSFSDAKDDDSIAESWRPPPSLLVTLMSAKQRSISKAFRRVIKSALSLIRKVARGALNAITVLVTLDHERLRRFHVTNQSINFLPPPTPDTGRIIMMFKYAEKIRYRYGCRCRDPETSVGGLSSIRSPLIAANTECGGTSAKKRSVRERPNASSWPEKAGYR